MSTTLTGFPLLSGQDLASGSTTQTMPLGSYMETADGRGFRYARNGAVATIAGQVYQSSALDATNLQPSGGLGVAANVAVGATAITISTSITLTLNQLAGGYLSVDVTPGQGYLYRIAGNTAVTGATGAIIYLEDPIEVALTTSSKVIVVKHPYDGTVVVPATPTGLIAGVPNRIYAISSYYWIQTHGMASVLFTGTGAAGKVVGSLSGGTIGSMAPAIAATNTGGQHVATGITGEYSLIFLTIN